MFIGWSIDILEALLKLKGILEFIQLMKYAKTPNPDNYLIVYISYRFIGSILFKINHLNMVNLLTPFYGAYITPGN